MSETKELLTDRSSFIEQLRTGKKIHDCCSDETPSSSNEESVFDRVLEKFFNGSSTSKHFHHKNVQVSELWNSELGPVDVSNNYEITIYGSTDVSWKIYRSIKDFIALDKQLHACSFRRRYSKLPNISYIVTTLDWRRILHAYIRDLCALIKPSVFCCAWILLWFEMTPLGTQCTLQSLQYRPCTYGLARVMHPYNACCDDELTLIEGSIVAVLHMPSLEKSPWWRGRINNNIGYFPGRCVNLMILNDNDHGLDLTEDAVAIDKRKGRDRSLSSTVSLRWKKTRAALNERFGTRIRLESLRHTGIYEDATFGVNLSEYVQRTGRKIPLILSQCIEEIEEKGIVPGIYRLSALTSHIQQLRMAYNMNEETALDLFKKSYQSCDINVIACLLKLFFRELSEPLFTSALYDRFLVVARSISLTTRTDTDIIETRSIVNELPPAHYDTLRYLMAHLVWLSNHSEETKMTVSSLAMVWAPNILQSFSTPTISLISIKYESVAVKTLIENFDEIFVDEVLADNSNDGLCSPFSSVIDAKDMTYDTSIQNDTIYECMNSFQDRPLPQTPEYDYPDDSYTLNPNYLKNIDKHVSMKPKLLPNDTIDRDNEDYMISLHQNSWRLRSVSLPTNSIYACPKPLSNNESRINSVYDTILHSDDHRIRSISSPLPEQSTNDSNIYDTMLHHIIPTTRRVTNIPFIKPDYAEPQLSTSLDRPVPKKSLQRSVSAFGNESSPKSIRNNIH